MEVGVKTHFLCSPMIWAPGGPRGTPVSTTVDDQTEENRDAGSDHGRHSHKPSGRPSTIRASGRHFHIIPTRLGLLHVKTDLPAGSLVQSHCQRKR
jgi:hypothetical protein